MKYGYNWLNGFWGNVWTCQIMVSPGSKVKQWLWSFLLTNFHVVIKTTLITIFTMYLAFSHIWRCCQKGQGQPQVIIWKILVVLRYPTLHTKFQGHWFWRWFLKVFTTNGHGGHLGHVTQLICINFHSYSLISFHMAPKFLRRSPLKLWTDDWACLYYLLSHSLWLRVAKWGWKRGIKITAVTLTLPPWNTKLFEALSYPVFVWSYIKSVCYYSCEKRGMYIRNRPSTAS